MEASLIDRWTDTAAFRVALFFSGLIALPVLLLGLVTTVGLLAAAVAKRHAELEGAAVVLLSVGGALGFFLGYLRAHKDARDPTRHDITTTLLCLAIGVATALFVAGFVAAEALESWLAPWGSARWLAFAAPFVTAHVVWAVAGIGWMQRVVRRYAEDTDCIFDSMPVVFLAVAISLATAAVLVMTAL